MSFFLAPAIQIINSMTDYPADGCPSHCAQWATVGKHRSRDTPDSGPYGCAFLS
jgi:hypothetical protein